MGKLNKLDKERLKWLNFAQKGMLGAIGADTVLPTFKIMPDRNDALKFILSIALKHPLQKNTRKPLRNYLRAWAKEFNCEVPIIDITKKRIQAEILTKKRIWNRNEKGKFIKSRFSGRSR